MVEVIKVCKNCHGYEPCLCDKHDYVLMWTFVYAAMLRTKGG